MEALLAMSSQHGVPQQQALLAGIASVTHVHHQQVSVLHQAQHMEL